MTNVETAYLLLVAGAFAAFCGVLVWAIGYTKKPEHRVETTH